MTNGAAPRRRRQSSPNPAFSPRRARSSPRFFFSPPGLGGVDQQVAQAPHPLGKVGVGLGAHQGLALGDRVDEVVAAVGQVDVDREPEVGFHHLLADLEPRLGAVEDQGQLLRVHPHVTQQLQKKLGVLDRRDVRGRHEDQRVGGFDGVQRDLGEVAIGVDDHEVEELAQPGQDQVEVLGGDEVGELGRWRCRQDPGLPVRPLHAGEEECRRERIDIDQHVDHRGHGVGVEHQRLIAELEAEVEDRGAHPVPPRKGGRQVGRDHGLANPGLAGEDHHEGCGLVALARGLPLLVDRFGRQGGLLYARQGVHGDRWHCIVSGG